MTRDEFMRVVDESVSKRFEVLDQRRVNGITGFQVINQPTNSGCRCFTVQRSQLFLGFTLPGRKLANDFLQACVKIGDSFFQGLLPLHRQLLEILGAERLGLLVDGRKREMGVHFNQSNLLCLRLSTQGIDSQSLPLIHILFDGFGLLAIALDFDQNSLHGSGFWTQGKQSESLMGRAQAKLQRFHRALLADREANIGQRLRGGEIEIRRITTL